MRLLLLVLAFTTLPHRAPAQVHLTARAGFVTHGAHAIDPGATDAPSFRPGAGAEVAAAVGYDAGAWRFGVGLRRAPADLILAGGEVGVITHDALTATGVALEIGRRLVGHPTTATLHVAVGAERTRWSFNGLDDGPRTTWGGIAALEGAVPLGGAFAAVIRLDGARGGSVFDEEVLPDGFERRLANRVGLTAGLRWRR